MTGEPGASRPSGGLPRDALGVAAGLGVLGLSAYAFLGLAARSLDAASYADLAVLWTLFHVVGPGLFAPVELEVGRAVADRRARGQGVAPLARRALLLSALLAALLAAGTALAAPALVPRLLGSPLLLVALLVSVPGAALTHLTRGLLAGTRSVGRYALQLGAEGLVRAAAALLLWRAAVESAGVFGLVLGLAALVAVAVALPPRSLWRAAGPPVSWRELSGAVGWLMATSVLQQVLVNSGPVVVALTDAGPEQALAGPVLAGIVLTRLPLFLFTAVQAVLLPRLAGQLGRGEHEAFVVGLRRLLAVVALVGVLGCVLAAAAGPLLLEVLFGPRFVLDRPVLAGLAAASGLYMAAVVLNHSLIALRAYAASALGWAAAAGVFGVALVLADSVLGRAVWSYVLGCGAALAVLGVLLALRLRRLTGAPGGSRPSAPAAPAAEGALGDPARRPPAA